MLVREYDDTEVLEIAIIENIQRADLNPIDEAAGYRQLMERFGHTQDKLAQRLWLRSIGAPVPDFQDLEEPSAEALLSFGLPAVQKARRGGYDGRGVLLLREHADIEEMLPVPSIVERLVPIGKDELAVAVDADHPGIRGQTQIVHGALLCLPNDERQHPGIVANHGRQFQRVASFTHVREVASGRSRRDDRVLPFGSPRQLTDSEETC